MCNNLDGMAAYKEEAISQGARDYCQTIQMLQVPTFQKYNNDQNMIQDEKFKSIIQNHQRHRVNTELRATFSPMMLLWLHHHDPESIYALSPLPLAHH